MAARTVGNVLLAFVDLGLVYWIYHEIRELTNFKRLRDPKSWKLDPREPSLWINPFLWIGGEFQTLSPIEPSLDVRTYVPPLYLTQQQYDLILDQCDNEPDAEPKKWHQGEWVYWPNCNWLTTISGWTAHNDVSGYEVFQWGPYGTGLVRVKP